MTEPDRPSAGGASSSEAPSLPARPLDVAVLGAGRVGGSFARALRAAGHRVVAEIRSGDDPARLSQANAVVIAVPDDALSQAVATAARRMPPGAVAVHTSGLRGASALAPCGPNVAAIHPPVPIPTPDTDLAGIPFGVTCPNHMRAWCEAFVADLGGTAFFVSEDDRARYHAALVMASNYAVALAGDAAGLLGSHELLVPLLRRTVENIATLGPDAALTGPVVRGDAGTVAEHLRALPPHLLESYVANARRALARAVESGRLDPAKATAVADALEEALVR